MWNADMAQATHHEELRVGPAPWGVRPDCFWRMRDAAHEAESRRAGGASRPGADGCLSRRTRCELERRGLGTRGGRFGQRDRSEEHTSALQSTNAPLVCRLL